LVSFYGRPQTFFQGRAKFSREGDKNILFAQKTLKKILFSSKKCKKNILFWSARGARAPSCPPLRTPMSLLPFDELPS